MGTKPNSDLSKGDHGNDPHLKGAPPELELGPMPREVIAPSNNYYQGKLDIRVWNEKRSDRRLDEVTPLKAGDMVRIYVQIEPASYMYLLWVDTDGDVHPIYPWKDSWGERRPEVKRTRLELPEIPGEGAPVPPEGSGMETVILLVRDTPLPEGENLALRLGKLPEQPWEDERAVVRFRNGEVDHED